MDSPSTPPALSVVGPDDDLAAPRLTVAAVARRLGVAPATLCTWARRYDVGPSEHAAGAHRRYSLVDVARLETMRRMTLEGVPPGEAARVALGEPFVPDDGPAAPLPDRDGKLAARRGGPGGRVLALPGSDAAVRGLGRAAMALDAATVIGMLREQIGAHGVMHTWDHVLRPVLVAVGARWAATGEGVEVEHLFSECVMGVMRATTARLREPRNTVPVLLACLDEEQHSLPIHALAAALAERGVGARQLGSRMPATAMAAAVRRSGPGVVFIFATMPVPAVEELGLLTRVRPAPLVVVGGPGWTADLPPAIRSVPSLQQAVDVVLSAVL